ncbi:uncharacterized protein LOC108115054 [Drosophila eugracilis]|uniref:uncharacterized protein LOC108115054 n=1 Tax=Drosophila eugracilis TaxID=29029 RepID=UPI001BDB226D|nr:uncharacterized protein LOC108115054 [Drosophila eugracilis]
MQGCWALSQDATGRGPHSNAAAMQRQSRDPKSTKSTSHYAQKNIGHLCCERELDIER